MPYKETLGAISVIIGLIGYVPYLASIIRGTTRPHVFTWVIWGSLTGIAFFAQVVDGAGPGAWVTGFTALVSFLIIGLALKSGEKNITRSDWLSFIGAVAAIPVWYVTKDPLWAVILVTVIDALGFYPTFRKSFAKPDEELAFTYALSGLKFVFALFALEHVSMVTALYPFSLVVMNGVFVAMLLWRRRVCGLLYKPCRRT